MRMSVGDPFVFFAIAFTVAAAGSLGLAAFPAVEITTVMLPLMLVAAGVLGDLIEPRE